MHADDHASRSEEELMALYVRGDADAHRALFCRLAPMVRAVALRALHDRAEADDVAQQTFLQVHRARREFRPGACVRPWVFTIAMNLVRDALRRRARSRELSLDAAAGVEDQATVPYEAEQERALVRRGLAALPAVQRRAIELHWLEDRSFAEVATLEGVSETAAKVRAHRGYRRLRLWLETTGRLSRT